MGETVESGEQEHAGYPTRVCVSGQEGKAGKRGGGPLARPKKKKKKKIQIAETNDQEKNH